MIKLLYRVLRLFSRGGGEFSNTIFQLTGCYPRSVSVFKLALLHKSVQKKSPMGEILSNERLEFLGDAILGAVIANELYKLFPDKDEGALTKMRSRIVNRSLLNQVGVKMGLEKLVQSQSQIDLQQTHILGDAVEALIGAVFVDRGYFEARRFIVEKIINSHINVFEIAMNDSNFKSILIEWGHKNKQGVIFQTGEVNSGPESPVLFFSKVLVNNEVVGEGHGTSKKEAQQNAAKIALNMIRGVSDNQE